MFGGWGFAKSAEAMFSRWAIKRACKFILKKKLGDYILGDIDLDQFDVQLREGTIQLNDLALNVDFFNQKLDGCPLMVKEGSIASLSIKVPWKMTNCQIEVDELELVLSPCIGSNPSATDDNRSGITNGKSIGSSNEKTEQGNTDSGLESVSLDVHEGVKTIAQLVKLFLTSFQVRLKNLIVAFDPGSVEDGDNYEPLRTLVLRVAEIEYGTCVSENVSESLATKPKSILGMSKLLNYMKFKDAVVEFLKMNDDHDQSLVYRTSGRSTDEISSGNSPIGCSTKVLGGSTCDGLSGSLNMTIPWKNGCLDIHKVDAYISLDPVKLSLYPSTIIWVLSVWESVTMASNKGSDFQPILTSSACYTCKSHVLSTGDGSFVPAKEAITGDGQNLTLGFDYTSGQEAVLDGLLPGTNVIHNWVPLSITVEEHQDVDPDCTASVDEFFECFDGIRNSQAIMSNSGLWNLTCSVFSAISAASSIASGYGHGPCEKQNVETNLKVSIAAFSVVLFSQDEQSFTVSSANMSECLCSSSHDRYPFIHADKPTEAAPSSQFRNVLNATCLDLSLVLQIFPEGTKFEVVVGHIKVDDRLYDANGTPLSFFSHPNNIHGQSWPVHCLQSEAQVPLPPFPFSAPEAENQLDASSNVQFYSAMQSVSDDIEGSEIRAFYPDEPLAVTLFESFGECYGEHSVNSPNQHANSIALASLSLKLPPFILWIDFHLVNLLVDLFKRVRNGTKSQKKVSSEVSNVKNGKHTQTHTTIARKNFQGNIVIPNARIMLCFCSENNRDIHQFFRWEKFISLEFSPSPIIKTNPELPVSTVNCHDHPNTASTCICLESGDLDIYLVKASNDNSSGTLLRPVCRQLFSAYKILHGVSGSGDHSSLVTMLWQEGPITGPWIAKEALNLAESQDPISRNKTTGKGFEFATVRAAKDRVVSNSRVRQEIVRSSAFLLHIHLPLVHVNIMQHDYELLHVLIKWMMDVTSVDSHYDSGGSMEDNEHATDDHGVQASVFLEFDCLDLCITLNEVEQTASSLQRELAGSWNILRLKLDKLELLSVSDIGGICGAKFFWISHGEGDLWGSVIDSHNKGAAAQDFLLITCKNSKLGRGDGEGGNAISCGPAGVSVAHFHNPQTPLGFSSVTVQCATIIAPGCRLDWVIRIMSFFSFSSSDDKESGDFMQNDTSQDVEGYKTCFFLDLVDVALSYEPYKTSILAAVTEYSSADLDKSMNQHYVGCILAAASFNLCNEISDNVRTNNYNVQLQDAGLLICRWPRFTTARNYDAECLKKSGYVKIASAALVSSVVRIDDQDNVPWEVEVSDSHVKLETCSDTTFGLVCLLSQLQQLFSPDMEAALVYLQSRWSSNRQTYEKLDKSNILKNSAVDTEVNQSTGLMDEIVDDFFCWKEMQGSHSTTFQHSAYLGSADIIKTSLNSNVGKQSAVVDVSPLNVCERPENSQHSCLNMLEFTESCYLTEYLSKTNISSGIYSSSGAGKTSSPVSDSPDCGHDGWYQISQLDIDANHLFDVNNSYIEKEACIKDGDFSMNSFSIDACKATGRILVKNTNIKWRMLGGSDWPEMEKNSSTSSNLAGRDESACLELHLLGLGLQHAMYPDGEVYVSKLSLSVQDFHLHDISKDAPWKLVLGYYHSKHHSRESCAKALKLDLECVRPDPSIPLEEYRLSVALLPIRLHLDQSQLNFLLSFFAGGSSAKESPDLQNEFDRQGMSESQETIAEEALLPFFQKCDICPLVVCVDYMPRNIDLTALRGGDYIQLINLVPWKGIDLQLKHVNTVGVYGWGGICEAIVGEWLEDISKNQVHKLLKGLKPVKSLCSVTSGVSKLVSMPYKSYREDRRLIKGMQRGAITFLRSITLEAVGLGVHLAAGAHDILLQTENALANTSMSSPSGRRIANANLRSNQPKDAQQGMQQAYESISDGFGRSASALVGTPIKTYQRGAGARLALASAIFSVPSAAVAPASAAARAIHCALLGVRNSLDPEHMKESLEKYHGSSQSQDYR